MSVVRIMLARVRALFHRNAIADEIREEMELHVRLRSEELARQGHTPEQARREAMRTFGNLAVLRDRGYDVRGAGWMETVIQDIRYGGRALLHARTFTIVALLVIALSIAAGTAIFSVVDAVALRGLPFSEHDRLAAVFEVDPTQTEETLGDGYATTQNYVDWRRMQQGFEGVAMVASAGFRLPNAQGDPVAVPALRVTWEFFPVLRTNPILGRLFTRDDETAPGAVVILSHGFWQRHFGGAADVIGKPLQLGAQTFHVVGVLPRGFSYPLGDDKPTDLYVPQVFREQDILRDPRGFSRNCRVIARLRTGVDFASADAQMNRVADELHRQFPGWQAGYRVAVVPLHDQLVGKTRKWMLLLLASVSLVILIGCANVANLMLARATVRAREMGVRTALGASTARLMRALLTESLLLALAGGLLGIGLAYGGSAVLRAWLPTGVPKISTIAINGRVLVASLTASVLTGLLFGLAPAIHTSRPNLTRVIKDGDRSTSATASMRRLRGMFVVSQVALAVVLLTGAGLFLGSFIRLMRIDPGFDFHNTLIMRASVRRNTAAQETMDAWSARNLTYIHEIQRTLGDVPGVAGVAGLDDGGLPFTQSWSRLAVTLPGRSQLSGDDSIDVRGVTANYFSLLRIPIREGRPFSSDDRPDSEPVVIVNQAAAGKYWPDRNPVGEHITIGAKERVVVGVVGDMRQYGLEKPSRQGAFFLLNQQPAVPAANLLIKTTGDPLLTLPAIKVAIRAINPNQTFSSDVDTLDAHMEQLIAPRRFNMALLTVLGVLGLVIATVGIFGVMAYVVAQRTTEIGVRVALGATPSNIVALVLTNASVLVGAGLAVGTLIAWRLSSLAESFLFQIKPNDPAVIVGVFAILAVAGLVAAVIPARRAAAMDPTASLRQ